MRRVTPNDGVRLMASVITAERVARLIEQAPGRACGAHGAALAIEAGRATRGCSTCLHHALPARSPLRLHLSLRLHGFTPPLGRYS